MAKGKDQDALGAAAENWIEALLTRAGVNCMRPMRDRAGYDMTCHLPATNSTSRAAAQQSLGRFPRVVFPCPSEVAVLLQVKASENLARSPPRVKLDNLIRFIQWPNPAFFLILEYAKGGEEPERGYLLHFNQQRLVDAFARWWKLDAEAARKPHKVRVPIPWEEDERLPELTGAALRDALIAAVGDDPVAYAEHKRHWRDGAGREGVRGKLSIGPADGRRDAMESMVDFALGLTERLPSAISVEEVRFGIPRPIDLGAPDQVYLSTELNPLKAVLEFKPWEQAVSVTGDTEGTPVVARLSARFYHPRSLFPFIPDKYVRYRIAAEYLDFIVELAPESGAQMSFRYTPPEDEWKQVPLKMLAEASDALRLLDSCARTTRDICLRLRLDDPPVDVPIRCRPHRELLSAELLELARAASDAWALVRAAGAPLDIEVSPGGLVDFSQRLNSARVLLESSSGVPESPITIKAECKVLPPEGKLVGMPVVCPCRIGDSEWVVILAVVAFGPWTAKVSSDSGRWRLEVPRTRCERVLLRAARLAEIDMASWPRDFRDAAVARLDARGVVVIDDAADD